MFSRRLLLLVGILLLVIVNGLSYYIADKPLEEELNESSGKQVVSNYLPADTSVQKAMDILCTEPALIDFGNIPEGDLVEGKTALVNRSNRDIEIVNIQSSCGCTSSSLSDKVIAAGQQTILPFSIQTNGKIGDFSAQFEISYQQAGNNEIKKHFFYAKLKGITPGRITAEPTHLSLGKYVPKENISASILLLLPDGIGECQDIPAITAIEKPDWVQTTLEPITREKDGRYAGLLKINGTVPKTTGTISDSIRIISDHHRFSVLNIPLSLQVEGLFDIKPKQIVKVISNEEFPFVIDLDILFKQEDGTIQECYIPDSRIECSYGILEQNKKIRLTFNRKDNDNSTHELIRSGISISICIHEEMHTFELPILIVVKPKEQPPVP